MGLAAGPDGQYLPQQPSGGKKAKQPMSPPVICTIKTLRGLRAPGRGNSEVEKLLDRRINSDLKVSLVYYWRKWNEGTS